MEKSKTNVELVQQQRIQEAEMNKQIYLAEIAHNKETQELRNNKTKSTYAGK